MNHLILGTKDKTPYILDYLEAPYLLIDDGSVIDAIPPRKSYTYFDPYKSYLDPLAGMNDRRARDFVALINAIFPEGENTLTRKNSNHYLLKQLLKKPKTLQSLITDSKEPAETDASQKIENLLLSPILKRVFKPKASTPHGVVLARLDRKKLGDFVAFVLAHALIGQFKGTIVIPDFGFYGRPYLSYLIREERLIAGLNTLSESTLSDHLLLGEHEGHNCTYEDAQKLATYAGHIPHTNGYNNAVFDLMGLTNG